MGTQTWGNAANQTRPGITGSYIETVQTGNQTRCRSSGILYSDATKHTHLHASIMVGKSLHRAPILDHQCWSNQSRPYSSTLPALLSRLYFLCHRIDGGSSFVPEHDSCLDSNRLLNNIMDSALKRKKNGTVSNRKRWWRFISKQFFGAYMFNM